MSIYFSFVIYLIVVNILIDVSFSVIAILVLKQVEKLCLLYCYFTPEENSLELSCICNYTPGILAYLYAKEGAYLYAKGYM